MLQTVQAYGTIFQVAKYSRRCWELFDIIATSIDQSSSGLESKLLKQTVSSLLSLFYLTLLPKFLRLYRLHI